MSLLFIMSLWVSAAYSQGNYTQVAYKSGSTASNVSANVSSNVLGVDSSLAFSAPQFFQKPKPLLLVLMKTDKVSPVCRQNIPTFAKLSKELNEAYGFNVVFQKSTQIEFHKDPMVLQSQVVDAGEKMGADATLLVYWTRKYDDRPSNDLSHDLSNEQSIGSSGELNEVVDPEEEAQYVVWNILKLKDLPAVVQHQDVMEGEQFGDTEKQVLFRTYQETRSLYPTRSIAQANMNSKAIGGGRREIRIQWTGLRTLLQLQKINEVFFNNFKDLAVLEPREFSKGTAIYAVDTGLSVDQLKEKLEFMKNPINDISPTLKMEVSVITE